VLPIFLIVGDFLQELQIGNRSSNGRTWGAYRRIRSATRRRSQSSFHFNGFDRKSSTPASAASM
jgi:hypothetical protein